MSSTPEECSKCKTITQALNRDSAKWCCYCGEKLVGDYVETRCDCSGLCNGGDLPRMKWIVIVGQ